MNSAPPDAVAGSPFSGGGGGNRGGSPAAEAAAAATAAAAETLSIALSYNALMDAALLARAPAGGLSVLDASVSAPWARGFSPPHPPSHTPAHSQSRVDDSHPSSLLGGDQRSADLAHALRRFREERDPVGAQHEGAWGGWPSSVPASMPAPSGMDSGGEGEEE